MPRRFASCRLAFAILALGLAEVPAHAADGDLTAAALGREIFLDPGLSASGQMSCATCHDPAHAHAQSNALSVQAGGALLDVPGFRSVPSLRYLNRAAFSFDKEGTPTAGFNRDGRAASLLEQAARPFVAPHEMALADAAAITAKVEAAPYADRFRALFGEDAFDDADGVFLRVRFALAAFEQSAPELHPFDAKYDAFLAGRVLLAPAELRGLALFNNPRKGNCNGCHASQRGADGSPPLFTDYTYDNLGVPRNMEIPANAEPTYFDLGLCGPDRVDLADRRDLCGAFKVPTLRNVATRQVFFHNGLFKNLRDAIRFYVRRDTHPDEFYPRGEDGALRKFDDLPAEFARNVNASEVPYDRRPGQAPRLDDAEIDDLVAFLGTLTDGYDAATDTADPARNLPPSAP
ncbi:cytochrome-c peroxidase [Dokdonella sp.]|uniref:cytochrome-c peroxidase n=1 Tax=Dokdonella sp. TaxID=2291710 RepID=UPI0037847AD6